MSSDIGVENMETENKVNGKMKDIEEFVAEYASFEASLRTKVKQISDEQLVTLYAIFRKDARTDRVNGNGRKPEFVEIATEKQKKAIQNLINRGKIKLDSSVPTVDKLTKRQASELLSLAYGGRQDRWRKTSTHCFDSSYI